MRTAILAVLCAGVAGAATLTFTDTLVLDTGQVSIQGSAFLTHQAQLHGFPNLPGWQLRRIAQSIYFLDAQLEYSITNPTQGPLPYCVDYKGGALTSGPIFMDLDEGSEFDPEFCSTIAAGETITAEYFGGPGLFLEEPWLGGVDLQFLLEGPFPVQYWWGATVSDTNWSGSDPTAIFGGTMRRVARVESTVTYEFIPEPSTYGVCGLGLGVLTLFRWCGSR